ncbi:MAG: hypothetical protein KC549_17480, partial [Myxococcales bacterium]|nr:hypothetical protein [Myxococcales bacterium]
ADPNAFPGDGWEACVSDGGDWQLAGASPPGSIGRIEGFESMADLLWRAEAAPDANAFIDAQLIYIEDGGFGSRVVRRYDSHVAQPEGIDCRDAEAALPYPDFCVGPVQMLPIINDAFDAGAMGEEPWINAARLEATFLWFLYVSTYKEANTCQTTIADCDSSWAYYGGGGQRMDPSGYGAYVRAIDPEVHSAVFDGLLAVRCWRDLDNGEQSMNAELASQAFGQLDSALDRSFALLLVDRLISAAGLEGDRQAAAIEAARIIGHGLDRALRAADPAAADALAAGLMANPIDFAGLAALVGDAIPCP